MIRVAQGSFAENVIALLSCAAFAESFKKPKDCAALITTNLNAALSKNRAMGQGRIITCRLMSKHGLCPLGTHQQIVQGRTR